MQPVRWGLRRLKVPDWIVRNLGPLVFCDRLYAKGMEYDALLQMVREMRASLERLERHLTTDLHLNHQEDDLRSSTDQTANLDNGGLAGEQHKIDEQNSVKSGNKDVQHLPPESIRQDTFADFEPSSAFYIPHKRFLGSPMHADCALVDDDGFRADLKNLLLMSLKDVDVGEDTVATAISNGLKFSQPMYEGKWTYCEPTSSV